MQNRRFSPVVIVGFVVAVLGMGAVGWWLSGPSDPVKVAPKAPVVAKQDTKADDLPASNLVPSTPSPDPSALGSPPAMLLPPPGHTTAEQKAREDADQKIGTLLLQNPTPEGARDKLLVLYSGFTSYEKIAAAPHIVNLVGDEQISKVVDFLKNPLTPNEAKETFFNDMLNRPPQVGWPVLVDVIGTPNHPLAQRAKELLTTIVGSDHGDDVAGWMQGIRDQMKLQGIDLPDPSGAQAAASPPPAQ